MQKEISMQVSPEQASNEAMLKEVLAARAGLSLADITSVRVVRRSIDARQRNIKINIKAILFTGETPPRITPFFQIMGM